MADKEDDGRGGGADEPEEITQVRVHPGREMTSEQEKRFLTNLSGREMTPEEEKTFLARIFSEAIGHDGWTVPHISGEKK